MSLSELKNQGLTGIDEICVGYVDLNNYKAYLRNEDIFNLQDISSDMHKLRKEVMDLQSAIKQDPKLYKLLQDISESDKTLFKLAQKGGKFSQAEYDYLLNNRTIDGIFSYKPRIPKPVDETTLQKLVNPAKRFFVDSEYDNDFNKSLCLFIASFNSSSNSKLRVVANLIARSILRLSSYILILAFPTVLITLSFISSLKLNRYHRPTAKTNTEIIKLIMIEI